MVQRSTGSNPAVDSGAQEPAPPSIEGIDPASLADPRWYLSQLGQIAARLSLPKDEGGITPAEAQKQQGFYVSLYENVTGQKLSDVGKELRDPLDRLEDTKLLEENEDEIRQVLASLRSIPGLSAEKKSRWIAACEAVLECQRLARTCATAHFVYVGRTQESAEVFRLAAIHHSFFAVWNDPEFRNSLTMAPPNHGKSTNFVLGQMAWDIAQDPELRCLVLTVTDDFAKQTVAQLRSTLRSGYFRALHPHIRVLGRGDDAEDSKKRFTVTRKNWSSREPTFEAAGIQSSINGRGYEHVYIDDPCDPRLVGQPSYRRGINESFEQVVEERLRDRSRARIRMVCTPWHPEDLAGKLRSEVAQRKRSDWRVASDEFAVKDDADGQPISLWPEKFDSAYYSDKRARSARATWRRLYLLQPESEQERIVTRLHYYPEAIGKGPAWDHVDVDYRKMCSEYLAAVHNAEQWLSIDPSGSSGAKSSKTGVVQCAITARGRGYIVDAWEFPGNPVAVQHWIVAAICGQWPEEATKETRGWRLPRKVDCVLIEWAGGPVGQVVLWEDYIRRTVRQLNPKMAFKLRRASIRPRGGGQNQDKTKRLRDAAGYLENPFIRFPGQLVYARRAKQVECICSDRENIVKLTQQIVSPGSTLDLLDAVTQWVREVEPRLRHDQETARTDAERHARRAQGGDPRVAKLLERLMKGRDEGNEFAKENEWLRQRSVA